jgi:Ca2+/Na+ antiporter
MFIGLSGFVVLESAGIWSGHKIAEYAGGSKFDWLMLIPVSTLVLYTTIGIGTLWFLDSLSQDVKIIGTSMFLLACVIYILFGLQSYQDREERKQEKVQRELKNEEKELRNDEKEYRRQQLAEKKQFERELKVKELELSHEENMAKITPLAQVVQQKKAVKVDEKKMAKLRAFLKVKPDALEQFTKTELAGKLGMSRPTLDRYLDIYNEEKNV